jgi:hypothetical protein
MVLGKIKLFQPLDELIFMAMESTGLCVQLKDVQLLISSKTNKFWEIILQL